MEKLLAICPYEDYMLKAIIQAQIINIAQFTLIGSRNIIIEKCYISKINYKLLNIIDITNEMDICFRANELLLEENITGVIFGKFSKDYIKNIVIVENDISIIDTPQTSHLLIVPRYVDDEFIGFEEKKQAIFDCQDLLCKYDINYQKIGFVTGHHNSTLSIERSIIKLDNDLSNYHIDIIAVDKIFSEEYNILIFNNRDAANIFIETILRVDKSKLANIKKASKYYVIDACELNYINLFFSIFMISKIRFDAEAC